MKKLIALFAILIYTFTQYNLSNLAFSKEPTLITFIYLNGSNDFDYKNRLKFKEDFEAKVQKLHPQMMKEFEENELSQKLLLKNGELKINPNPIVFYWGEKSLEEVKNIDSDLEAAKKYTPKVAQLVRGLFAHCLHDAIWVQKHKNMSGVIDDLQKIVKSETDKGHKVVLFGYSAGSFITYQYFLNKFTSIFPKELTSTSEKEEIRNIVNNTPVQPTCLDALMELDLVRLNVSGKFYTNSDEKTFAQNYHKLDQQTRMTCFKSQDVKGVVNFASPLILFYSDVTDAQTSINFLSQLMVKNIIENDIFFLTVNYRNDPLGFPNAENITLKKLQNSNSVLAKYYKGGQGFVYNKSDIYVPRTFISAHLAYWDTPKRFAKGVIQAYTEGFKYFYNP